MLHIYVVRYTKYQTRVKLVLEIKTINLNSFFNDVKLSQNARCIMEACYVPTIPGIYNYILVVSGASANDKGLDSKLFLRSTPVIAAFKGTDKTINYNLITINNNLIYMGSCLIGVSSIGVMLFSV
jgi:hypothetical protein